MYNLEDDLGERNDLADKYPEKVKELESLHEEWVKKCYPDMLPRLRKRSTHRFPSE